MRREEEIRVLIIEDDPEDRLLLTKVMALPDWPSFHFVLECAYSLTAGLEILSCGGIEAVLLDLMLPDSRGLDTLRRLRSRYPDVPIVILTGLRDESLGLEAIMHGAQDYQVKGTIEGHALKRTISYAVERHRMLAGLRNIIQGTVDGMVVVDAQGLVRHVNQAAETLLGRESAQLRGKPFPHPIPAGPAQVLRLPAARGEERVAELHLAQIQWEDEPARLVTIRDVTKLRRIDRLRAEIKERRRMDKLKDELMSVVSHEMRNPLTIIRAAVYCLEEWRRGTLSEEEAEMVNLQQANVLRLQKIVDHILDLSRLESGRAEIHLQAVDAVRLVEDTVRGLRLLARERNIVIQEELAHDLPPICADPELLVQILSNLLDNAMRFARTRILVRAQAEPMPAAAPASDGARPSPDGCLTAREYVRISVSDDGQGIPQDRMGDLFTKFVQVNRKIRGEGYQGTGLGLAICKEMVERLQGRIWVESADGHGAEFHFLLPRFSAHRPNPEDAASREAQDRMPRRGGGSE
ncbi:MAG: ATP-binding protein [Elusimicrobia bacterium]|nr:ATP-binding protein [Elusimicrobiota bacterium]